MSDKNIKFTCNRCKSSKYFDQDGFIFCSDCGLQAEQILEGDEFGIVGGGRGTTIKIKEKKKKDEEVVDDGRCRLTSWEGYNYILKGLTDELVEVTGNDQLRVVVLQLWARVLQYHQIAFFDTQKPSLPRMPAVYKFTDAQLLYNFRKPKKKRVRKTETVDTRRAKQRRLTRMMNTSQRSEYDSESQNVTLQSLVDMSATDLQSATETNSMVSSNPSIEFKFSEPAMKILDHELAGDEDHISEHQSDFGGTMDCHNLSHHKVSSKVGLTYTHTLPSPQLLLSILYMALNHVESDFQACDLVALCNNHLISYVDPRRLLPMDADADDVRRIVMVFVRSASRQARTVDQLSLRCAYVAKMLEYKFKTPNILGLCKRFCNELALPDEIYCLVERLFELKPPQFQGNTLLGPPCYEGRAMAYIIFVLKLLFGLDGVTEEKISKSAAKVNKKLAGAAGSSLKLFDFYRWMEYIEMRKTLLMKVHTSTHMNRSKNTLNVSTVHFLNEVKNFPRGQDYGNDDEEDGNWKRKKKDPWFSWHDPKAKWFQDLVAKLVERIPQTPPDHPILEFKHSLTPFSSYLEEIKQIHPELVPERLYETFKGDSIFAFIKPRRLRYALADQGVKLQVKPAPEPEHLRFVAVQRDLVFDRRSRLNRNCTFFKVEPDGDVEEWEATAKKQAAEMKNLENIKHEKDHQDLKKEFGELDEMAKIRIARKRKRAATDGDESDTDDENMESATELKSKVTLVTPHNHYWMFIHYLACDRNYFRAIHEKLPDSFNWLLNECAAMVEMGPHKLVLELNIIEAQFNYILEPLRPGEAPTARNISKLPKNIKFTIRRNDSHW